MVPSHSIQSSEDRLTRIADHQNMPLKHALNQIQMQYKKQRYNIQCSHHVLYIIQEQTLPIWQGVTTYFINLRARIPTEGAAPLFKSFSWDGP